MHNPLQKYGEVALITGASSGIGKAFAETLASLGFHLVLVARREELLTTIKSELEAKHSIAVHIYPSDLSKTGSAQPIAEDLKQKNITISLLINNAGFGSHGELDSLDIANEMQMVDVNCRAVVEYSHAFLPAMKQQKRGGIIFTASVLSVFNGPYMATYSATKAFDLAFAKALYGECKPHGIDVLAVLPGHTATNFFDASQIKRETSFPTSSPGKVVETTLSALGKKAFVADGLSTKLGIFFSRFMPTKLIINICKNALK